MGDRFETSTLQANDALQGDFQAGVVLAGLGLSFYTQDGGNVEIITKKGNTILYNSVPAGAQILTPMFTAFGANTASADITVALIVQPF